MSRPLIPIALVRAGRRLLRSFVSSSRRGPEGRLGSGFSMLQSSDLGVILGHLMGVEARLLRWFDLLVGVSIVCIARKPDS